MRTEPDSAPLAVVDDIAENSSMPSGGAPPQLDWDEKVGKNFVAGGWHFAKHGYEISVHSPTTIDDLGTIPRSAAADVDAALDAAEQALRHDLRTVTLSRVERFCAGLRRRLPEVAALEQADSGVPCSFADAMANLCADWADRMRHDQERSAPQEPVGCHGHILPAYAPFWLYYTETFSALLAGNAVVLKPSSVTPMTAVLFADLIADMDLPPGAFALLQGTGADAGAALARNPKLDHLRFIGSRANARMAARSAAEHLTPCRISTGNLNPSILFADGNVEQLVAWLATTLFRHAGQGGFASRWCLVPETALDAVLDSLRNMVRDDASESSSVAPLVSEHRQEQADAFLSALPRLDPHLDERSSIGDRGKSAAHPMGYYFEPSILVNAANTTLARGADLAAPVLFLTGYASVEALCEQLLALRGCGTADLFSARGMDALPPVLRRLTGRLRLHGCPFAPAQTPSFWHEINACGAAALQASFRGDKP